MNSKKQRIFIKMNELTNLIKNGSTSIPIAIDARRTIENVKVARALFYIVVSNAPIFEGTIISPDNPDHTIPILNQFGVIYRPNAERDFFTSIKDVQNLFDIIEDNFGMLVEFEDFWIPESWFNDKSLLTRGNVFRISNSLFQRCYQYREGFIRQIVDFADIDIKPQDLIFSEEETNVFRAWNQMQIDNAIELYPKNENYVLEWDSNNKKE